MWTDLHEDDRSRCACSLLPEIHTSQANYRCFRAYFPHTFLYSHLYGAQSYFSSVNGPQTGQTSIEVWQTAFGLPQHSSKHLKHTFSWSEALSTQTTPQSLINQQHLCIISLASHCHAPSYPHHSPLLHWPALNPLHLAQNALVIVGDPTDASGTVLDLKGSECCTPCEL